jgi:CheY-like chemotaxis protein
LKRLNGLRVLVVDDSEDTREFMALFLAAEGASVVVAGSAHEALQALASASADVLVCDIGLPDIDGCALLSTVRALPPDRGANVPAVALTGYSEPETRDRILAAGFQIHVLKPVEPGKLIHVIASAAGRDCSPESNDT